MTQKQFKLEQVTDHTIQYHTPNGETCKTIPNILMMVENDLNTLCDENNHIKQAIKEAYNTERTALGRSVLRQLIEQME